MDSSHRLNHQYVGVVEGGRFVLLLPEVAAGSHRRLTTLDRSVAQPPELDEIHLDESEGQVVLVTGEADSQWIWSAQIVEVAGPIVTALAKALLRRPVLA
ncbi:hypothetical protein [Trichothermofontia sp.]